MKTFELLPVVVSPVSLAAYLAIFVGSLVAYACLSKRWRQRGHGPATRAKELAALVLAVFSALFFAVIGNVYMDARVSEARMRAEVQQRTALAVQVRNTIADELEAVRTLLITRTQQKIMEGKLTEARSELARFVSLQDPQIVKIIALIDKELDIRKLLEQSRSETVAEKLSAIYSRLAELAPDTAAYKENAARYSAIAQQDEDTRVAIAGKDAQTKAVLKAK